MIETPTRVASSFAVTLAPTASRTLPAVARGTITEQFDELCKATTEYRAQLKDVLDRTQAAETPPVIEPARSFVDRFQPHALFSVIGAVAGAGVAYLLDLPANLLVLAAGGCALLGSGTAESFHWYERPKPLPAPPAPATDAPPAATLEEVLDRVHDTGRFSPATLVALSAMAQERLDDKKQALSAGVRAALAQTVWHGESQSSSEILRSARWVDLKRALDGVAELTADIGQWDINHAYSNVADALKKLEPDEKVALAPVIRDATFEGEKPRRKVGFAVARDLHQQLWNASPQPLAPIEDFPEPKDCSGLTRLGREVYALEEAVARAVDDGERCIEAAVLAVHTRYGAYAQQSEKGPLGFNAEQLARADTANAVADAKVIGPAAKRALAGWHTDIERAALAHVAKRGLELLDLTRTLGTEARELLTAIVERGKVEGEGLDEATVKEATRLYNVLDVFNDINVKTGSEKGVADAMKVFHENVHVVEKAELALAIREHVVDAVMNSKAYFSGAVNLHRELRGIIENG